MKERPILFNGDMVRAILDGRKTQTRRVIRGQENLLEDTWTKEGQNWWHYSGEYPEEGSLHLKCPFGKPGDRLWVRETFNTDWGDPGTILYKADGGSAIAAGYSAEPKWRPSIHMPRWASRITLEITNVRVERLQDISESDAVAEGMIQNEYGWSWRENAREDQVLGSATLAFSNLINRLHGGPNWNFYYSNKIFPVPLFDQNPWVWAIEFKRLT